MDQIIGVRSARRPMPRSRVRMLRRAIVLAQLGVLGVTIFSALGSWTSVVQREIYSSDMQSLSRRIQALEAEADSRARAVCQQQK
jgi:hypothetical protein